MKTLKETRGHSTMEINVQTVDNGYTVEVKATDRCSFHVFKNTEEQQLLEYIGKAITTYGVDVVVR